jgi:lipid A ethanolaminephosphotransferase
MYGAPRGLPRITGILIRLGIIAALVILTNAGFMQRVELLIEQDRWIALVGYLGVWGICAIALLIAAFHPNVWLRAGWALIFAFATAVGFTFRKASGSEFGILDAVSLWNARHEASRAAEFYGQDLLWFAGILIVAFVVLIMPPALDGTRWRRWMRPLALVPAVPVLLIGAILYVKEGGGAQALPAQFAPLSVAAVSGSIALQNSMPARRSVEWTWRGPFVMAAPRAGSAPPVAAPGAPAVRHVVVLVDESIRADYIDWTPGNPNTPELALLKPRFADFGPAAAGATCSHYANAILRFAAARGDLGGKILTNPTLWQYAKKAGFRTVFIDAQAAYNRNPGKLQNFMTAAETKDIDGFYAVADDTPGPALDDWLLEVVMQELRSEGPVFIYATKNGAHIPYDRSYPESERHFGPTMAETGSDTEATRIASYRNAVRWSVDRIFKRLFDEADLSETVIIYTSDHGQAFNPNRFSHCSVEDPDPREALVPLMAVTGDSKLHGALSAAAAENHGAASHFEIAPTLLKLMGYRPMDVATAFGPSLFEKNTEPAAFTTGDVFGLFSSRVRWHAIDLGRSYFEPAGGPLAAARTDRSAYAPARETEITR